MATGASLRSAVHRCLQRHDLENATFLGERLFALDATEQNRHLLATAHYRAGRPQCARALLQRVKLQWSESLYLMAKCCLDMDLLAEAENCLVQPLEHRGESLADELRPLEEGQKMRQSLIPGGAHGVYLLGVVVQRTGRNALAAQIFQRALEMDSFLWCAYEALCELGSLVGANADPDLCFRGGGTFASASPPPFAASASPSTMGPRASMAQPFRLAPPRSALLASAARAGTGLNASGGGSAAGIASSAELMGEQITAFGRVVSAAELFARVEAVDVAAVQAAAYAYADSDHVLAAAGQLHELPSYDWFRNRTHWLAY